MWVEEWTEIHFLGIGAIASNSWVVGVATVAVATLFLLGRGGPQTLMALIDPQPLQEGHIGIPPLSK